MNPERPVQFDPQFLNAFGRRHHIRRLSLFGSALTERFNEHSDIDLLVEFEPDARVSLLDVAGMELELEDRLGRRVDLRTAMDLSRYFRDDVVRTAELLYAA